MDAYWRFNATEPVKVLALRTLYTIVWVFCLIPEFKVVIHPRHKFVAIFWHGGVLGRRRETQNVSLCALPLVCLYRCT